MRIDRIELNNYRNYERASAAFSPGVNVIYGENGRGKTNLLEAVYQNCGLGSWRGSKKEELTLWGKDNFSVESYINVGGMDRVLRLSSADGKKLWTRDGARISPSDTGFLCVLFEPGELDLVKGPSAKRRRFIDGALFQLRPRYRALWREYNGVLMKKTAALKEGGSFTELLPEYNERLAAVGEELWRYRAPLIKKLALFARGFHEEMSGGREALSMEYKTVEGGAVRENILEAIERLQSRETASKRCLAGVHHDDMIIDINGRPARAYASQGQARTAAVALMMALREVMREDRDEFPVMILDDVFSELDETRREYLIAQKDPGQVLISSCSPPDMGGGANYISADSLRTKG